PASAPKLTVQATPRPRPRAPHQEPAGTMTLGGPPQPLRVPPAPVEPQ
ncbi:MAG: hypothetical protein JWP22_2424, partial [Ramlibacter sp.]|nr:hypothetical protein [Ramlibacter sp.]